MIRVIFIGVVAAASLGIGLTAAGRGAHVGKPPSSDSSGDGADVIAGRDALRRIVQEQCVVHWTQKQDPQPCLRVFLPDSKTVDSGYAVLPDRKGGAHYLLIPTQTFSGIDSSELLDPDTPNYFAEAWRARDALTAFVGHPVPRTAIGLAINTARSRSQDQFHIHIECLQQDVATALRAAAGRVTDVWAPLVVTGSSYEAQRVMGEGLDGANLFESLAKLNPDVRHHMGDYTLVAAGMQFADGPGFIILTGTGPTGELLLDPTCAVAGAGG